MTTKIQKITSHDLANEFYFFLQDNPQITNINGFDLDRLGSGAVAGFVFGSLYHIFDIEYIWSERKALNDWIDRFNRGDLPFQQKEEDEPMYSHTAEHNNINLPWGEFPLEEAKKEAKNRSMIYTTYKQLVFHSETKEVVCYFLNGVEYPSEQEAPQNFPNDMGAVEITQNCISFHGLGNQVMTFGANSYLCLVKESDSGHVFALVTKLVLFRDNPVWSALCLNTNGVYMGRIGHEYDTPEQAEQAVIDFVNDQEEDETVPTITVDDMKEAQPTSKPILMGAISDDEKNIYYEGKVWDKKYSHLQPLCKGEGNEWFFLLITEMEYNPSAKPIYTGKVLSNRGGVYEKINRNQEDYYGFSSPDAVKAFALEYVKNS